MASSYPGALDSFTNPASTDAMDASAALYHDVQHANINDAVEAVQAELGTDPAGAQATVKARMEYVERYYSRAAVWPSGGYIINSASGGSSAASTAHDADTVYYSMWLCPFSVTLDRIAVRVGTAAASANARLAVYSADGTTKGPGSLLLDAGEIDCSGTGTKELTVSQALTGGEPYWLALHNETGTVAFGTVPTTGAAYGYGYVSANTVTVPRFYLSESLAYTSGVPTTATALSSLTHPGIAPAMIYLRRT